MCALDNGFGAIIIAPCLYADIEHLVGLAVNVNLYLCTLKVALCTLNGAAICIFKHLQLVLRLARHSTKSYGDRQTSHAGVRNTYTHGIFVDVRA